MENVHHVRCCCNAPNGVMQRDKYFGTSRDLREFLGTTTYAKKSIAFMHETKLLKQFRNVDAPILDEVEKGNQPSSSAEMKLQE